MNCEYCGTKSDADANYCSECGENLYQLELHEIFHTDKSCPFCPAMKAPIVIRTRRPWRTLFCTECENSYKTLEIIWSSEKSLEIAAKNRKLLGI
ncbi:hypothetical protein ACFLZQ_05280 [Thermodesulfobacteriota bacterium]